MKKKKSSKRPPVRFRSSHQPIDAVIQIRCLYDELVPVQELKPHPKNPNEHPEEQIERLVKILEYQGWRYPIKVSKRSGFITSGHGRLQAAFKAGWKVVPVNYQDYESEEQEYADVVADNAIADWADLDLSAINANLENLGPDLDPDLLGIEDFELEPADKGDAQLQKCPECGQKIRVKNERRDPGPEDLGATEPEPLDIPFG